MRKICVITGTRAEYGLLKPVMAAIRAHNKLSLMIMATGAHLSEKFGKTIELIRKDRFLISYSLKMNPKGDKADSMALAVGEGIRKMTNAFKRKRPDLILVLGDRIEALAGTIAASYLNIPVAHIHGGDITKAGLDESARHAISKFAHIHFPATKKSKSRLIKMGESTQRIFLTGSPGLDAMLREPLLSKQVLLQQFRVDFRKPVLLILQHSVTTQINAARSQIRETLKAIKELKMETVLIYPSSDAGGRAIIREIEQCRAWPKLHIFKNVPRKAYLSFLKFSAVLIGNSSSGIIESSIFKLPVVNIGIRQEGRERSNNVIDVPHRRSAITSAIKRALYNQRFQAQLRRCRNPYGDGKASSRIVSVLSRVRLNNSLLQKQIAY